MKTLKTLIAFAILFIYASCTVGPQPIQYGEDSCYYCQMTIVDKVHAAEIVTSKGKAYKFDAIECMVNFRKDFDTSEIALYLNTSFSEPGKLIDATNSTFLISENIPSPMGAFLSAFKSRGEALKTQSEKGGQLYSWEDLLAHLK
ncbi:MAG: nitrous oxide reductase accessory protein NosL [Bacteroidia bacterium]|nr:nitrous oxide reductase accessory protein NosL [Bacteroidia bacterium]NND52146.1 hypothetical protein [Flavobacteriaceae bacterium]